MAYCYFEFIFKYLIKIYLKNLFNNQFETYLILKSMSEDNNQEEEVKDVQEQNEEIVNEETTEPKVEEEEVPKVVKTEENVFIPKKKGLHRAYLSENSVSKNVNESSALDLNRQRSSMLNESHNGDYGNKLYKNQSASTLHHSICSYTIPRQERWNPDNAKALNDNIYNLKTTLSTRGSGIGYGNRGKHTKSYLAEISNTPGPNHYINKSEFNMNRNAKTFGLGYKHYAKCLPPGIKNYRSLEESNKIPGPSMYFQRNKGDKLDDFAPCKPRYTIVGKGKMMSEIITEISPGAIYNTKFKLVEGMRYSSGTGLGFGKKIDVTDSPYKANPGPGSYK